MAGMAGRVCDLGQSAQKGVLLAVDGLNAEGGVDGRTVELYITDDMQDPQKAEEAVRELLDKKVAVIVGHMSRTMSVRGGGKLVNDRKIPMLSPTTTTTELSGLDDCFFRVIESTFEYSTNMANYLFQEVVVKSVAISNDTNNLASTKNWADHFTDAFEALGG